MNDGVIAEADGPPRRASSRRRKTFLRIGVLVLLIWPPLAWLAAEALIVRAELPNPELAVVLGGSSTFVERTHYAAQMYKEGRVAKIILTNDGQQGGWSTTEQRNPFFVERARTELEAVGVPTDKIETLPQVVTSTYEEALLLRQYSDTHRVKSIMVVTSAYHSRRALWTLRAAFEGTNVEIGIVSPPPGLQTPPPATWWLRFKGWQLVAAEYLKIAYYYLRY
jgi:uncharacterized SAM-binding protein YcdF (DUF218 family)